MKLNFCGICGSKSIKKEDAQQPVRQPKQKLARHKVQSPARKDDKALDEFIRDVQRQTSTLQRQNQREMVAVQKKFAQHQKQSDKIAKLFAPKYDSDEERALERELAELAEE